MSCKLSNSTNFQIAFSHCSSPHKRRNNTLLAQQQLFHESNIEPIFACLGYYFEVKACIYQLSCQTALSLIRFSDNADTYLAVRLHYTLIIRKAHANSVS